jgi:hypothetical protein
MTNASLDRPVSVFVGLGFPKTVKDVFDAYATLVDWNGISDLDRAGAIEVCRKAMKGERTGKDVRLAFQRFAHNKGILCEDFHAGSTAPEQPRRAAAASAVRPQAANGFRNGSF